MNALGVPFGKKAGIIRVPNYIFGLPECHILKFIGSLFDTDGSVRKDIFGKQHQQVLSVVPGVLAVLNFFLLRLKKCENWHPGGVENVCFQPLDRGGNRNIYG